MIAAPNNVGTAQAIGYAAQVQTAPKPGSTHANQVIDGTIEMTAKEINAHNAALDALARNYDSLPKDPKTGYVSMASLESLLKHPEGVKPEVLQAATYFKNHPNQFTALETSRERYDEKKTDRKGDGLFSLEDIKSERAHGDVLKADPKTPGVDSAGRKELTKAETRRNEVMEAGHVLEKFSTNGVPDVAKIEEYKAASDKALAAAQKQYDAKMADPTLSSKERQDAKQAYDKVHDAAQGATLASALVAEAKKKVQDVIKNGPEGFQTYIKGVEADGVKAQALYDKTAKDPKASDHDKAVALDGLADAVADQQIAMMALAMMQSPPA